VKKKKLNYFILIFIKIKIFLMLNFNFYLFSKILPYTINTEKKVNNNLMSGNKLVTKNFKKEVKYIIMLILV